MVDFISIYKRAPWVKYQSVDKTAIFRRIKKCFKNANYVKCLSLQSRCQSSFAKRFFTWKFLLDVDVNDIDDGKGIDDANNVDGINDVNVVDGVEGVHNNVCINDVDGVEEVDDVNYASC